MPIEFVDSGNSATYHVFRWFTQEAQGDRPAVLIALAFQNVEKIRDLYSPD
jgi:hypothetical protein